MVEADQLSSWAIMGLSLQKGQMPAMTTGHNASSVNGGKGGKDTQSTIIMNRKQFEF